MCEFQEVHESQYEGWRYRAATAFWDRMTYWVRGGRYGVMPYPQSPPPPTPPSWWQIFTPLYTEADAYNLCKFYGEVMEFSRWIPWTRLKDVK